MDCIERVPLFVYSVVEKQNKGYKYEDLSSPTTAEEQLLISLAATNIIVNEDALKLTSNQDITMMAEYSSVDNILPMSNFRSSNCNEIDYIHAEPLADDQLLSNNALHLEMEWLENAIRERINVSPTIFLDYITQMMYIV